MSVTRDTLDQLDALCYRAESLWTFEEQEICSAEECAEYAAEVIRAQIGKGSAEARLDELADVYIMARQMSRRLGDRFETALLGKMAKLDAILTARGVH